MFGLFKSSSGQSKPKDTRSHIQRLEEKAARADVLERELLGLRQEMAATELRKRQDKEKALAWDRLHLSVSMRITSLPASEYNHLTCQSLDRAALNWATALDRAGLPADGLIWYLEAANNYKATLQAEVNEGRTSTSGHQPEPTQ
ncbi:hypothetical protein E4656_19810 [Natronospirillum operosum]|uniref:Uncharacterized protein n=1 Tax=Natronospirillum operosum TaxID=2759953 RepID=A0A4Z0W8F9_9GAMM|nr:hypothetical protein [Natronospirillum operosum]TGG89985.1 hypothetical protein E4656_19810 [Natronospirillum operosum]